MLLIPKSSVFRFAYAKLDKLISIARTLEDLNLAAVNIDCCPVPQPAIKYLAYQCKKLSSWGALS